MRIAYLTAGAAGMYCGSCMHDNALARQLQKRGVDCVLQPVYTPIRTDEDDVSRNEVFFGGIQIYLLQKLPWLRYVPAALRHWLDSPRLLRWATQGTGEANVKMLGELTISMLRGMHGRQRDEVLRLAKWLREDLDPSCVLMSNFLIGGAIPEIRKFCPQASIAVTLQGDDIFLDHLGAHHRAQVIELLQSLVADVDQFIVHSAFYGQKMAALLDIPAKKIIQLPLAIDCEPFDHPRAPTARDEVHIGYLARLAPEKGLHHLVDAFVALQDQPLPPTRLRIAGWQGSHHAGYIAELQSRLQHAGLQDRVDFVGSPDLAGKCRFLREIDILSVPTQYADPKGLFILEAWAAGVPVVQPDHGGFPELLAAGGGGRLVAPGNTAQLAAALAGLVSDPQLRQSLGENGRQYVRGHATIAHQADRLLEALRYGEVCSKTGSLPS